MFKKVVVGFFCLLVIQLNLTVAFVNKWIDSNTLWALLGLVCLVIGVVAGVWVKFFFEKKDHE